MPVLSFYEGISELTFLLLTNSSDFENVKSFRYPYVYSEELFEGFFSKEDYYNCVFDLARKQLEIQGETEMYSCGVMKEPEYPNDATKKGYVLSGLPENHVYISSSTFAYGSNIFSMMPINAVNPLDDMQANLSIYKNVIYYEMSDILNRDAVLREIVKNSEVSFNSGEIVFTGERCADSKIPKNITYLFMLDVVRDPGIYHIKCDSNNLYPHAFLADVKQFVLPSVGTLVNSPGKTECLYETDVGTSQLVDLESEKLFVLPLETGASARVMVKNSEGQHDTTVYGGDLGVILDTRDKSKGMIYKESSADALDKALHKL